MIEAPCAPTDVSDAVRHRAGLSYWELWLRYVELGGLCTVAQIASFLHHDDAPDPHDHDLLAHALNERLLELGQGPTVAYALGDLPLAAPPQPPVPERTHLGLLGGFSFQSGAGHAHLPMSAQRVVCFLALHDGVLLRRHVAETLWSDTTDEHAAGSLRSALWRLGHATSPLVECVDTHLRIHPDVCIDLHASEALARRILDPTLELSESDLDDRLLSAELLPDWAEEWVLVRRNFHTQLRLRALESLCERLSALGRFGEAVQAGTHAVAGEPLRESAQRVLVMAHLAEGNVAAAQRQYDSFRDILLDELGVEPSRELQAICRRTEPMTPCRKTRRRSAA